MRQNRYCFFYFTDAVQFWLHLEKRNKGHLRHSHTFITVLVVFVTDVISWLPFSPLSSLHVWLVCHCFCVYTHAPDMFAVRTFPVLLQVFFPSNLLKTFPLSHSRATWPGKLNVSGSKTVCLFQNFVCVCVRERETACKARFYCSVSFVKAAVHLNASRSVVRRGWCL